MGRLLKALLDFIYPPRCSVCGAFIWEHRPICPKCEAGIGKITHPICVICGLPFFSGEDHPCGDCSNHPPPFDRARSAAIYAGSLQPAITHFKFGRKTGLAKPLGKLMAESLIGEFEPGEIDCIIPVPLHRKRLRWRGFNQALLLAREISAATGLWVDPLTLKRIRETRPQTRLPFKERGENVRGAFAVVRETFVRDRSILLVDDVFTTGSTIIECSRMLKKAGAARIQALTVARATTDI